MLIASVSAKSAEMKSGVPWTSLISKSASSLLGNSTDSAKKSSIRRLQDGNLTCYYSTRFRSFIIKQFSCVALILCSLFMNCLVC